MIQGWKVIDDRTISEITVTGPIPDHETVVWVPARMAPFLLEVCDGDGTDGTRPRTDVLIVDMNRPMTTGQSGA